ncbi:MAG: POTRA domain-containing protein [bacterium]
MSHKTLLMLALMLILSLSFELSASTQSYSNISKINIIDEKGESPDSSGVFISVLGIRADVTYSEKEIQGRISRMEDLLDCKTLEWKFLSEQGILILKIAKKKKIAAIAIQGNTIINSSDIQEEVGTKLIGTYCEDACDSILQKIKRLYKGRGFLNTNVTLTQEPVEANEVNVAIKIEENEPVIIKQVNIESDGSLSSKDLNERLNIKEGDVLNEISIHDRIRSIRSYLYNRNYYASSFYRNEIKISPDTFSVSVDIGLRTGPKFNIVFKGNNTFTDPKSLIGALDITETDVVSKEYYSALIKRVEDFYKSYGFSDVSVEVKEELGLKKGELDLVFVINEGTQKFFGNLNFIMSDSKYKRQLKSYLEDNEPDLFSNRYFIKNDLENLKDLIERFFNEESFLRTRVVKVNFIERKKNIIDVNYEIDSDQATTIRGLDVKGNTIISSEKILNILGLEKGEMIKISRLSSGIKDLIQTYREQGYVDMSIDQDNLFSYSDDYRFVDVFINIIEGSTYKVGKIFMSGLVSTKDRVVSREMRLKEGEKINLDLIQSSENAISSLSIFGSVSVLLLPTSVVGSGYRDILVKVEEKKAGVYEVGFGYRTDTGVRLATGLNYYNLGGWNRRIYTNGVVSRRLGSQYRFIEYEINGGYYEPYFLNIPFDFRVNVGFKKEDLPDYGRKKLDISFYLEKQMGSHYVALRNAFERINIFAAKVFADESIYWKYSIQQSYRYDSRDSVFNPTRGINFLVYGEWGHSLKSAVVVNYLKAVQKTKAYFTPVKDWVFVTGLEAGYIKGLSGESILQDDRFSLGGVDSIRGYREKIINDTTPQLPFQYYYTFSAELRRNLFWRFVGSVFHDIGTIYSEDPSVQGPFSSVGAGLSIKLPVGSISLQYGYIYSLTKRIPPDRVGRLHLAIGTF